LIFEYPELHYDTNPYHWQTIYAIIQPFFIIRQINHVLRNNYFRRGSSILNTMGGIKVNDNMDVINKRNRIIPGLYAAGVDVGGWTSDTCCAALPGTAFGFAINSGRIAGENAAKYTRENPPG
jgi:succinate dehydrogenase/fumarate reductase flavoprotein subunit